MLTLGQMSCLRTGCWVGTGGDSRGRNKDTGTCKAKLQLCLKSSIANTFLFLQTDSRSHDPSASAAVWRVCLLSHLNVFFFLMSSAIYCFWETTDWCGAKNKGNTLDDKSVPRKGFPFFCRWREGSCSSADKEHFRSRRIKCKPSFCYFRIMDPVLDLVWTSTESWNYPRKPFLLILGPIWQSSQLPQTSLFHVSFNICG